MEKLQDIRTTIEQESADLLAVADAYEINARNLDAEAEKLRTLAREAREQEANLRRLTAWRATLTEAPKLCPRCGSPCTVGTRGRWDDTKRWACTCCTWNDIDLG